MRIFRTLLLVAGLFLSLPCAWAQQTQTVLTSLQATYSIASVLVEGTSIRVQNVPPQAVAMDSQAFALSHVDEAVFRDAEAVITIGKLWREDPLFPVARSRNVRIVNIDAAFPLSGVAPGISVIRRPISDVPWASAAAGEAGVSRYVWLSPTNAARMAELVAADLSQLSPTDAQRISANLTAFTQSMRELKAEYGAQVARLTDARVFSLAEEFVYLYSELGIFVDGWFVKQDVNWSEADFAAFSAYLKDHQVHVVVHKWEPDAKIAAAISASGAKLVVLDSADPGRAASAGALPVRGFQDLMKSNFDTLLRALSATSH